MNILFAITAHGFGHGAISAPLVKALRRQVPDCRVTLHTRLPREWLSNRIPGPFDWTGKGNDFGLRMYSPIDVDVEASTAAYDEINRHWGKWVDEESNILHQYAPDVVVSNVSFLVMEAARLDGIPAVTFCPFNWLDTHRVYCDSTPGAKEIQKRMGMAYAWATTHIRPEPSVPVSDNWPKHSVGPVCSRGVNRSHELKRRVGADGKALVLVTFGGIKGWSDWSFIGQQAGIHWLVADNCTIHREDVTRASDTQLSFEDLLTSADLIITKPGYATFTEAVAAGIPIIVLERPDWPEWPYLKAFAEKHVGFVPIARGELNMQRISELAGQLLEEGRKDQSNNDGAGDAAFVVKKIGEGRWTG